MEETKFSPIFRAEQERTDVEFLILINLTLCTTVEEAKEVGIRLANGMNSLHFTDRVLPIEPDTTQKELDFVKAKMQVKYQGEQTEVEIAVIGGSWFDRFKKAKYN